MLLFAAIAGAILVTGTAALPVLWKRLDGPHDLNASELLAGGAVLGLGGWIAIHWILALAHVFTRVSVALTAAAFVTAALVIVVRVAPRLRNVHVSEQTAATLAFLVPVLLWTIFILWRGTVIPPLSHDALAYHLPKAVLMMRAEGFVRVEAPDIRIASYPFNYELLLADVLVLGGTDRLTEWIGTVSFLLFLVVTAAAAQRWWKSTGGSVAAVLAVASAPVVLLHSGADKNDLLMSFFALTALLFGARWCIHGGRTPLALLILSLVLGVGTKLNVAAIGIALAPFLLARVVRLVRSNELRTRSVIATTLFSAVVFLLCGGWSYIANMIAPVTRVGVRIGSTMVTSKVASIEYGDWFNLWQFPYLLLTIPFAPSQHGVWVPWAGEYWFWPHYEIYWSHYGYAFTAGVLLLPFASWRYRSTVPEMRSERTIAGIAALAAMAIMLPVVARPIGFYGTFPRYVVFILPVICIFSLTPAVEDFARRWRGVSHAVVTALVLVFAYYAVRCAELDRFAPMEFVMWASKHPGTRDIPFMRSRAATIADRRAGPNDKIVVDGAFDTWVYPAYGARLTRPVEFLPPGATAKDIPADADWVIVDRSFSAVWGHSELRTTGNAWKLLAKGTPPPEDVRLAESLRNDPRFKLVYRSKQLNQAVFRRIPAAP